jgi:cell division protein FtsW
MKRHADRILLGIVAVLVLFGFFMLASALLGPTATKSETFYSTLFRQLLIGLIGGGSLLYIASLIPYQFWRKIALPLFLTTFFLTILVFVPHLGFEHAGAKRWLSIGPLFFQPSELLKFGFLVYLSSWLASRKEEVSSFKFGFFPFLIITAFVAALLIMEPNISTLLVITFTAVSLFFIAGGRFKQIAVAVLIGIGLTFALIQVKPYLKERLTNFLNPAYDPQGSGYQLSQSLIAFGSGGIFGKGFGMSIQKFNYLPEPTGDSIFAVIGEEFGFLGTSILIVLFLVFLYRGLSISSRITDNFGRLLGSGIVIMIMAQSFMNMAAMVGIFPLTGLPLLFISQGGSALALTLAEVGVLLNISKFKK